MRIARFQLVSGFQFDPAIVLTCGRALQQLRKVVGGSLLSLNVPDGAPPFLPRAALKLQDSVVSVATDRLEVVAQPPAHVAGDVGKAIQFAVQRSEPILSILSKDIPPYQWSGVILAIQYPEEPLKSSSGIESVPPVFDRMLRLDRKDRELSAFQTQFGFKEAGLFVTYTASPYETRRLRIPAGTPAGTTIDASEIPLTECGLQVDLDINNKPSGPWSNPVEDQKRLLAEAEKRTHTMIKELNLEGLL